MDCPEYLVFRNRYVQLWHWQRADVRRQYVSWGEVFNPLRYELVFRWKDRALFTINDEGRWNLAFARLMWVIYRKRRWEKANKHKGQ
jgi:hypothetical protein